LAVGRAVCLYQWLGGCNWHGLTQRSHSKSDINPDHLIDIDLECAPQKLLKALTLSSQRVGTRRHLGHDAFSTAARARAAGNLRAHIYDRYSCTSHDSAAHIVHSTDDFAGFNLCGNE